MLLTTTPSEHIGRCTRMRRSGGQFSGPSHHIKSDPWRTSSSLHLTFAFGGDLGTVVRLQQAAWAVLMLALAATAQAATRNAGGLVPIILVATYPGLLLFRNVLTAELLFAVFLNLAMAGLLVGTCVGKTARCCAVAASVPCAALAACFDR